MIQSADEAAEKENHQGYEDMDSAVQDSIELSKSLNDEGSSFWHYPDAIVHGRRPLC